MLHKFFHVLITLPILIILLSSVGSIHITTPHPQKPTFLAASSSTSVLNPPLLPVWPVQNGLISIFLRLFSKPLSKVTAQLLPGLVVPTFDLGQHTSPFLLLVHHHHTFLPFDPIRPISKLILPEGFPAHPHRGFVTLTIVLKGGLVHRDSIGIKQRYGANPKFHSSKNSQWLMTGSGVLHEEMWDVESGSEQELYQIWVDVPQASKMNEPQVLVLGGDNECPTIIEASGSTTKLVVGGFEDSNQVRASVTTLSQMTVACVSIDVGAVWTGKIPRSFGTIVVYVRSGRIEINGDQVDAFQTAIVSASACAGEMEILALEKSTDVLILAGEPLNQPVVTGGSFVMTSERDISIAKSDYQRGKFGIPFDHKLSDEAWAEHVKRQ